MSLKFKLSVKNLDCKIIMEDYECEYYKFYEKFMVNNELKCNDLLIARFLCMNEEDENFYELSSVKKIIDI